MDKIDSRAKALAAMGAVSKHGDAFTVTHPTAQGKDALVFAVKRNDSGKVECECAEYKNSTDPAFRCEHILAVKYFLLDQQREPETNEISAAWTYAAVKRNLAAAVPVELIRTRQQGNADIEYINVTDYKDLLDQRAGIWEALVSDFKQIGSSLCCVVKLIIHCEDGIYAQDGTGIEPIETTSYGDPFSNAYAQAFRRACEGHGLSRELWRQEHGASRPVQAYARAANGNGHPSKAENLGELITAKQLGMVRALARELHMDADEECQSVMDCRTDELSKNGASSFIKHLQEKQRGGPSMPVERTPLRRAS